MEGDKQADPERFNDSRYRELIESSSELTLVLDGSNMIEYVNGAIKERLGFDRSELLGENLRTLVPRESNGDLIGTIAGIRTGEDRSNRVETRFKTAAGDPRTVDILVDSIGGDGSEAIAVTARPKHNSSPETSVAEKERMALALEGANLGIWDWNIQTDEVQRDELVTEMLGYSPEEFGDHIDDWERLVHPAGKQNHEEAFSEHAENRTPYYECEYRMRTAGGDWKWVRTIGKVVERDETGSPVRAVGIHQNIDARKRAELALKEERDLFRTGPSIVFKWRDEAGWPIEYVSPNVEEILGYAPSDLQSGDRRFADLVHEEDIERLKREVAEQTAAGQTQLHPDPYRVRTSDEEICWVMEYTRRIDEPGDNDYLLGYLVDITERRKHEENLETQRDNLEILNQVVRHDIRNELQLVVAHAETLDGHVNEEGKRYLAQIQKAAGNAVAVTKTARDVMEVMLRTDAALQPVDLRSVLEHQIDDVRSSQDRAVIRTDGTIPAVSVIADNMLGAVFRNLLKNAIQHNDQPVPKVTVSAIEDEDTVQVQIADNGPGIPDNSKSALFEKGKRGLDSDGTGLGLYLVDTLLTRYDGDILVEDNDPTGTIFVVELAIAET